MLTVRRAHAVHTSVEDARHEKGQSGYAGIEHAWLNLHYKTTIGLLLLACLVEVIMGIMLIHSDMLSTTAGMFILKFMVFPMGVNLMLVLFDTLVLKSRRFSYRQKIFIVSLVFAAMCLVLYTVHSAFTAMYYLFAIAIMLTTIYASYRLTLTVSAASIASVIISELFIVWDVDKQSIFDNTLRMSNFVISILILIAFSIACMVAIRYEQRRNETSIQMEKERQHLQQSLKVDEMTGIFNRNALHAAMKGVEGLNPADKYILAIADIDHFKQVNDQYGHHVGDHCIAAFADILKESSPKATPYRYGGDEFCLLFCGLDMGDAIKVCDQIRTKLSSLCFEDCTGLRLSASFGLAVYEQGMDEARFFIHADIALYKAKEVRDAVRVFQKDVYY